MWKHSKETDAFNVLPLFWHNWGKNEDHVTRLPALPLRLRGQQQPARQSALLDGARRKGRIDVRHLALRALPRAHHARHGHAALLALHGSRHRALNTTMLLPFSLLVVEPARLRHGRLSLLLARQALRSQRDHLDHAVLPAHARPHRLGTRNLYPFLFLGRKYESTHTVVAPVFWDFASPKSRTTVGFPLYWRFADENLGVASCSPTPIITNGGWATALDWEFHFFPAFSYGETPDEPPLQ